MTLLPILLVCAAILGVAYLTYGKLLTKLLRLDPKRETPAVTMRDGLDYEPIEPKFLMSQHFSAIAAAGPIVGPIAANGLAFKYYNSAGAITADRTQVTRIAVTVRGQSSEPIRAPGGSPVYAVDSMTTQIALRNNRRW